MNINELRPAEGSKRTRKRIGRGHGTGWGKTAGKGHNGQKQRSGSYVSAGFEGGQMPLVRRIPKRGFSNSPFKQELVVLNIKDIINKFENGEVVSIESLIEKGILSNVRFIRKADGQKVYTSALKLIGSAQLDKALTVKAEKISKTVEENVKKAGGSVELLSIKRYVANENKVK